MRSVIRKMGLWLAVLVLGSASVSLAWAADKATTFTGTVSDAMCGAQHMMEGSAESCTRACVNKGSKYALVVGSKVYTLDTSDQASLIALDKLAGAPAKVTGTVSEDTIAVKSVAPAKR